MYLCVCVCLHPPNPPSLHPHPLLHTGDIFSAPSFVAPLIPGLPTHAPSAENRGAKIAKQIRTISRIQELIEADPVPGG